MTDKQSQNNPVDTILGWGGGFILGLLVFSLVYLAGNRQFTFLHLAASLVGAAAAFVGGYRLVAGGLSAVRGQSRMKIELDQVQAAVNNQKSRVALLQQLNANLLEAVDERSLVSSFLTVLTDVTGAAGGSFTPLDDWGQPLAYYSQGKLPESVMRAWAGHLNSAEVRQRCLQCEVRLASSGTGAGTGSGQPCPLAGYPGEDNRVVQCLPVAAGPRLIGMVNLYWSLPAGLDADTVSFLNSLLNDLAVGIDLVRLRGQESTTLSQINQFQSPRLDLEASLGDLLEKVRILVNADFALLAVQPPNQPKPILVLTRGEELTVAEERIQNALQILLDGTEPLMERGQSALSLFPEGSGAWLGLPLVRAGHVSLGGVLLGSRREIAFTSRQKELSGAIASELAVLVEYGKILSDLEYQAVVHERARLAREIHDGLAQTLAFLKLQIGQMQNLLKRGDLVRLSAGLASSYGVISEAYLDTRQSIENLRLTPEEGLQAWLEQTCADFRSLTGLNVELSNNVVREISFDFQAQLIRIIQEALNNIRKHASARQVWITLREWANDLIIEVRDNGVGFSPEDVPGLSQFGLRGMRERAELIGADFQIISQPQKGTIVRVRLPHPLEETVHG